MFSCSKCVGERTLQNPFKTWEPLLTNIAQRAQTELQSSPVHLSVPAAWQSLHQEQITHMVFRVMEVLKRDLCSISVIVCGGVNSSSSRIRKRNCKAYGNSNAVFHQFSFPSLHFQHQGFSDLTGLRSASSLLDSSLLTNLYSELYQQ